MNTISEQLRLTRLQTFFQRLTPACARARRLGVLLTLLLCALIVVGCGKKGPPAPQDEKKKFAWQRVEGQLTSAGCLSIAAALNGAVANVESFTLELEPQSGDICVECPFDPLENVTLAPQERQDIDNGALYLFAYCPQSRTESYRWRLVARNVFNAFPHALSPVQTAAPKSTAIKAPQKAPRRAIRLP